MAAEVTGPVAEGERGAPGYRLMLKEMAPDERPRERLKLRGPASLSDGGLLAIILNTGVYGSGRPGSAKGGRRRHRPERPSRPASASPRPSAVGSPRAGSPSPRR